MKNFEELKSQKSEETCLNKLASAFIDIALHLINTGDLEEFEDLAPPETDVIPSATGRVASNTGP